MAQPVNTYSSNDMNGLVRDFKDAIYDISPTATPLLTRLKKTKATNKKHEWQTDQLRSSASNANIEGSDITPPAITPTVELSNQVQIFVEAVTVSDLSNRVKKYGRDKEMAYQMKRKMKVLKLDGERALYLNNAKVTGTDSVAGEFAGLQTWFTTNTSGGSGASDATGDGTDARTAGTNRALTQTIFETVMQACWTAGGSPTEVYLHGDQMAVVQGFTGFNNQRTTVVASENKVINAVEIYQTQWGTVKFKMCRECPSTEVFILDPQYWSVGELQAMRTYPLAKTGSSEKQALDWVWTLAAHQEQSSGLIADLS